MTALISGASASNGPYCWVLAAIASAALASPRRTMCGVTTI
jgi:hypothetical protein